MSAIAWLSRQEIVALGWTLLHFLWQGTAIAVVYAMLRRRWLSAQGRYILACMALAAMAVAAFLTSLPLMIWEVMSGGFLWPGRGGLLVLAFVALGPAFIAQLTFMRGVELIGPGRAGVFVNLVPVFGAIMAVVILSEPFALYQVLALLLVVGGIAIAQRSSAAAQR